MCNNISFIYGLIIDCKERAEISQSVLRAMFMKEFKVPTRKYAMMDKKKFPRDFWHQQQFSWEKVRLVFRKIVG